MSNWLFYNVWRDYWQLTISPRPAACMTQVTLRPMLSGVIHQQITNYDAMPATLGHTLPNKTFMSLRRFPLTLVPLLIAISTGSNNVALFPTTPISPGNQMLGRTLKAHDLGTSEFIFLRKFTRVFSPHGTFAIIATALLTGKSDFAGFYEGFLRVCHNDLRFKVNPSLKIP